jgi:hypothetical protein
MHNPQIRKTSLVNRPVMPHLVLCGLLALMALVILAHRVGNAADSCSDCPRKERQTYFFWEWPAGVYGRSRTCSVPWGAPCSCPPQGPYYGYFATQWQRWPQVWNAGEAPPQQLQQQAPEPHEEVPTGLLPLPSLQHAPAPPAPAEPFTPDNAEGR